jgi:hypothetical protein
MGLAVAAVLLTVVLLAVMVEGRARTELSVARGLLAEGHLDEAVKHYGRSLTWYVPGGGAEIAAEEMLDLGLKWLREGRPREAGLMLSRMRSGLYGDRHLFTPRPDLITRAEPELARLRAVEKLGPEADPLELEKQAAVYLKLMERPARPGTGPGLAAAGGFLWWVAALLFFIAWFFGGSPVRRSRAWWFGVAALAGYGVWLWGLMWS